MGQVALFEGLIVDEAGEPVGVVRIGDRAFYTVDDMGFLRHIPAEAIDRQVLERIREPVLTQREDVVAAMLQWMGKEDLFTKAIVEHSLDKLDERIEQLLRVGLPEESRAILGMMGFRVVIDVHGEIVEVALPSAPL